MSGPVRTGGVSHVTTHGQAFRGRHTGAYAAWRSILLRLSRDPDYVGVSICSEWRKFEAFYASMGDRPAGMSVGRRDNSKGYCPENCRWETAKQQANNRSTNRFLNLEGRVLTLAQWAEIKGLKPQTVSMRLNARGWSVEKALNTPVHRREKA